MAVCKTADYDDNAGSHNSLATETAFITYTMTHRFNEPCECVVVLDDSGGAMSQKYDVDAGNDSIWIGSGRLTIEDPASTTVFDGRVIRAEADAQSGLLRLFCLDWMSQLKTPVIHYDTRADLGSGVREGSPYRMDASGPDARGVEKNAASDYRVYDTANGGSWTLNQWNTGYYLVFSHRMAGDSDYWVAPDQMATQGTSGGTVNNLWEEYGSVVTCYSANNGDEIYIAGKLSVHVPAAKISRIDLDIRFWAKDISSTEAVSDDLRIQLYDNPGTSWENIHDFDYPDNLDKSRSLFFSFKDIAALSGVSHADMMDSSADAPHPLVYIKLVSDPAAGNKSGMMLDYIRLTVYYEAVEGDSTAYDIDDTGADYIQVSEDLVTAGIGEHCPYAVCQVITAYVDELVTDYDPLKTLSTSKTTSTTVVAQHFAEMSPLQVLQMLAQADGAVLWCTQGGTTINWKDSFSWSSGTLSDSDVLSWGNVRDFQGVANEWHIAGIRTGSTQLYVDSSDLDTDPGADSKTTFGLTQAQYLPSAGVYSLKEAETLAETLVERDEDVHLILTARMAGLSSQTVGDVIRITSTRFNLTNEDYVVAYKRYDHKSYTTVLRLYPIGAPWLLTQHFGEHLYQLQERSREAYRQTTTHPVFSETWS